MTENLSTPIPDTVLTYRQVGEQDLRLFTFVPPDFDVQKPRAGVLIIHGGGWRTSSAEVEFPHARALADAGLITFCLEYRLAVSKSEEVRECVRDACAALKYLQEHAAGIGLIADQVAVCGASAGGHLALGICLFDESYHLLPSAPNAMILRYAVVDTSPAGYGYELLGPAWESLSPLHHLRTGLPPTLMFHGTADTLTPYVGAVAFRDRMLELGNSCQLVTALHAPHTHVRLDPQLAQDATQREIAFLRSLDWSFPQASVSVCEKPSVT